MIYFLIFSLFCVGAGAEYVLEFNSFSPEVGKGTGNSFASSGEGRITGIRVWEISGSYIRGIQLKYGNDWTPVYGRNLNEQNEMLLSDNEEIVQISGKYSITNYIYQLVFLTSTGRFFSVGQPTGTSFNLYPQHGRGELQVISGRYDTNGITSIAAHWALFYPKVSDLSFAENESMLELN